MYDYLLITEKYSITAVTTKPNVFSVTITSKETLNSFITEMESQQFSCFLYLVSEGSGDRNVEEMYNYVDRALVNCPEECRPFI